MLKVDKYEKDSDLHIVAMVDEKFLTDKYGAEGTQNIENFMDVANQGVVKEYMFDYLYDEMIKDDPVLLQQIKDELPGADQEVIDKEFNERIKKKLKSNFVDSIRVVNSDDMTQGFAIQHVETIGFMPMYGKTGPLVMPFDELKDYSYRKHRIDPALQDNLFNDFTEILRKAGKE